MEAKMICVMDAKIAIVPKREWEIVKAKQGYLRADTMTGPESVSIDIIRETVHGQAFVNANGDTVCIGISEDIQKALGLPFKAFNGMREEIDGLNMALCQCRSRSAMYQKRLENANDMSFFRRLLFLFRRFDI